MTLSPTLTAAPIIQFHVAVGVIAILLGPLALYRKPGTKGHKVTGYIWVSAMALLALSSFGIHGFALIGPFSPLHGLTILTLWSLYEGIRRARAGQVDLHRRVFRNLYWFGVMVAGLFNFLPGRAINRALFPATPDLGYLLIVSGLALAAVAILRRPLLRSWRTGSAKPQGRA